MDIKELMRLLRLHEADKGQGNGGSDTEDEEQVEGEDDKEGEDITEKDEEEGEEEEEEEVIKLTQKEIDKLISDKLESDRKERQKEKDKLELDLLEEQGKYKELAETLQNQIAESEKARIKAIKVTELTKAGYEDEQVDLLVDRLKGDTHEDVINEIKVIAELFPTKQKYVDPSRGNPARKKPTNTGGEALGRSMFERVRGKNK